MSTKEFDFESFIAGISATEVTVEVSTVDHSYEIEQLQEALDALPEEDEPKRVSQKSQRTLIAQQIEDLRAEEDAAPGMAFRLRPLTPDEAKHVYESEDDTRYWQVSKQCVAVKMGDSWGRPLTEDEWRKLADALETPRFSRIMRAATQLTMREGKSPAFSLSDSAGRLNSSKN